MRPGRNDPCPCGSGKKYKRCHGSGDAAPAAVTDADRELAVEVLAGYLESSRFADDIAFAYETFWNRDIEDPPPTFEAEEDEAWLVALYSEWLFFDVITQTGRTLAEHALDDRGHVLSSGGRRYLQANIAWPMRFLQVIDTEPPRQVRFRDLLERGIAYQVESDILSGGLNRHDIIAARLVRYADQWSVEGTTCGFLIEEKEDVRRLVRRTLRRARREKGVELSAAERRFEIASTLVTWVADAFLEPEDAPLRTHEGHEVRPAWALFEVLDPSRADAALDAAESVKRIPKADDGARFVWIEGSHDSATEQHILGVVVWKGDALEVATLSVERAQRAQTTFSELLGTAARFVAVSDQAHIASSDAWRFGMSELDGVLRRARRRRTDTSTIDDG